MDEVRVEQAPLAMSYAAPAALGLLFGLILVPSGFFFFVLWPLFAVIIAALMSRRRSQGVRGALVASGVMVATVVIPALIDMYRAGFLQSIIGNAVIFVVATLLGVTLFVRTVQGMRG